jgi:hydrophobe/amphiphile efflux-1 (HAE1) family protein
MKNDLPSLSVRRPVLVLVVNLLIIMAGLAALKAVEVRELPDVDRPVVTVRVVFPGASPETMDTEVISLLEGAVARVSGIKRIRSASEEGTGRIYIEFRPGSDLDTAASDVREAVSQVSRRLPPRVEQVVVVKADDDAQSILSLAVSSNSLPLESLTKIVEKDVIPALIAVDGVADVQLTGNQQRILRVAIDPLRLASYQLTVADVADALRNAPFDVPAGSFRSDDQQLLVRADATVTDASEIGRIVVRDTIRISDVASVYFGPENSETLSRLNRQPVLGLGVVRQARSNTIEISENVQRVVASLDSRFDDLSIVVTDDQAAFIKSSVTQVLLTLAASIAIVFLTIWIFIGDLRATLVPSFVIPVALIGTIAAIWLFGFSINILTLLALVLAVGLVVDDAIVVLENIQHQRGLGVRKRAASVLGTRQVFFAVIATTIVLVAVFIPISFMPSTAGRLFREFGIVLAVAVIISSFVALTIVPAASSRFLRRDDGTLKQSRFKAVGDHFAAGYHRSLGFVVDRPLIVIGVAALIGVGAWVAFQQIQKELIPEEDRGVVRVFASGPDSVGVNYMDRQAIIIEDLLMPIVESGEASSLYTQVGQWDPNRVFLTLSLADWSQRQRSQQEIAASLRGPLGEIPGARVVVWGGNSLNLRGRGSDIQVALLGNDYEEIFVAAQALVAAIEERLPALERPRMEFNPTQPQLSVSIDRQLASDLDVDLESLAATLRAMIDGDELVDINVDDEAVPIVLESGLGAINDPSDLNNLFVRSGSGAMIPLSSLVQIEEEGVATELNRQAQRRAIEVQVARSGDYPLQSAVDDLEAVARDVLPDNVSMIFLGEAAALQETSNEVALTILLAFVVIFLVLAAQFEGFTSAIAITLIVPFGVASAVFALVLTGTSLNVYSQIGLVLLIGLMAKNSVLLVEFADQLRDSGAGVREAITAGATRRLRPVMMTLVSTILGSLPLILSSGAGAEARSSIGWVVFGGLGISAVFTLYLTPALYMLFAPLASARSEEAQQLGKELDDARQQLKASDEAVV